MIRGKRALRALVVIAALASLMVPTMAQSLPPVPPGEGPTGPGGCPPNGATAFAYVTRTGKAAVGSTVQFDATKSKIVIWKGCEATAVPLTSSNWQLVSKPSGSAASLTVASGLTASLKLDVAGLYRVRFNACPSGCSVTPPGGGRMIAATRSQELVLLAGASDLWAMGLELNQGFQDQVYNQGSRAAGTPGSLTLGPTSSRPVIPGKPLVVRVYVGSRYADGPVQATGRLFVRTSPNGAERTFSPLDGAGASVACSGPAGQSCRSVISVSPPISTAGLPVTGLGSDLDLINERASWSGTLNFFVPASVTSELGRSGQLILRATVDPVGVSEVAAGDNAFTLNLRNVAQPKPLRIRLVRVGLSGLSAPSITESQQALNDVFRLLPYNRLEIARSSLYHYDGAQLKLKIGLGPLSFKVKTFSQCDSLWIKLYRAYGLDPNATLVALLPSNTPDLKGCSGRGGEGWKVPRVALVTSGGGIMWSKLPSSREPSRLATLAQELYHAELDRRHVSNDHGESGGCPISDDLSKIIGVASFGSIDADCYKSSPYQHGAIGAYPESTGGIAGDRGGVGIDAYQSGSTLRLGLFDPCPTGPLGTSDVKSWIAKRYDLSARKPHCTLSDSMIPHDFMSYGPNRWTSKAQFFGGPQLVPVPVA